MTYGGLRYRLSKSAPGVDLELIDGWIQDRYTKILDALPWRRLEGESVYQWPTSYAVGTLTATQGSAALVGDGTGVWTAAMSGLMIRIANGPEYYLFTYVDATHGTLDRPYEGGTTGGLAGSGLAYRIDQAVFALPGSARILRGVRALHPNPPIEIVSQAELNRIAPRRPEYGSPRYAALSWDSYTKPPYQQLELYPIPSCPDSVGNVLSYVVDYVYDADALDASQTSTAMLPWVRPSALVAGVMSDIALYKGDLTTAEAHGARFTTLVKQMAMINAQQQPAEAIQIAPEFRPRRIAPYRRGPWHGGFTG